MRRWPLVLLVAGLLAGLVVATDEVVVALDPVNLDGYSVVYSVEDRAGRKPDFRTEVVEVSRPYGGRVEQRFGDEIRSGQVTNREFLWQLTEGGELLFGVRRPPGGPPRDGSYKAFLDAAADGVVEAGGAGEALRRRCTWFAYREPDPKPLAPPTATSRIETCIDPAGIVLRETWIFDERVVRVIEAISLDVGAPPGRDFLEGKDPSTEEVKQPEAEEVLKTGFIVADDVDTSRLALGIDVPKGWTLSRRTLVALGSGEQGAPTQIASDAFLRGEDLAVVERGTSPTLSPPWGPGEGSPVRIGATGQGRLVYFTDHVEVRLVGEVGFARVIAPDRDTAMRFARALRATA